MPPKQCRRLFVYSELFQIITSQRSEIYYAQLEIVYLQTI